MKFIQRTLFPFIQKDLKTKIVLLAGSRQTGKTTLAKKICINFEYLNFDAPKDRGIMKDLSWRRDSEVVIFDEIHKMKRWKSWIKGIYDTEGVRPKILVTGSASLDVMRKGGDSLAGRHFSYRIHPFTVKELLPLMPAKESLGRILSFGGFPEPFLEESEAFARRWRASHQDVILRQDLIDLERVREIKSIEILLSLLSQRVGSTISYQSLAEDIGVSIHTIKHWLEILERLFVIFRVAPYSKKLAAAIRKESKYFFFDTGVVSNGQGARLENAVACALLAELHEIEDTTGRKTALHFIRDKQKHEVDFLTLIDGIPHSLIEVKAKDEVFSPSLLRYKAKLGGAKLSAYQIVLDEIRRKEKDGTKLLPVSKFLEDPLQRSTHHFG